MLAGDFTTIHVAGVQRRQADQPGRALRRQPHRSGPLQPGGGEPRRAAAQTTDPCGQIKYDDRHDQDEQMPVARIDYQMTQQPVVLWPVSGQQIVSPRTVERASDNILKTSEAAPRTSSTRWFSVTPRS